MDRELKGDKGLLLSMEEDLGDWKATGHQRGPWKVVRCWECKQNSSRELQKGPLLGPGESCWECGAESLVGSCKRPAATGTPSVMTSPGCWDQGAPGCQRDRRESTVSLGREGVGKQKAGLDVLCSRTLPEVTIIVTL